MQVANLSTVAATFFTTQLMEFAWIEISTHLSKTVKSPWVSTNCTFFGAVLMGKCCQN